MRNGYLALVIFCCFALCVIAFLNFSYFFSKGYQSANEDHQSTYSSDQRNQLHYEECVSKTTTDEALKCYQKGQDASKEQQRADHDLNAQREMADWAEGMLWATIVVGTATVIATSLGVYFVRETLTVSNETNKAAVAAANAANEANRITREENRPWVTLRRDIECDFIDNGWGFTVVWSYNFENLGKSPAYDLRPYFEATRSDIVFSAQEILESLVEKAHRQPLYSSSTPILFPGEITTNHKHAQNSFTFNWKREDKPGKHTLMLLCLRYNLGLDQSAGVGIEGRVFLITPQASFIGPYGHQMLELASMRIVR